MPRTARVVATAAALSAAATLMFATAASASEEDAPFVTSIQVSDYQIASGGCHHIPLTVDFDSTGTRVTSLTVQVSHGDRALPSVDLTPASAGSESASGHIAFCPKGDQDLGDITVGPTTLFYRQSDGSSARQVSTRQAQFTVDERPMPTIAVARHGHKYVVRARARVYDLDRHRKQLGKHLHVALQRRARGHSAWRTIGHSSTGTHGVAVFRVSALSGASFRVRVAGSGHIAAATSRTVRR